MTIISALEADEFKISLGPGEKHPREDWKFKVLDFKVLEASLGYERYCLKQQ